ncbi:endonuclease domain-containing protein [Phytohabitans kaempferiae]|uniref:Endonuclease domain-containing protein n=1 Tax=Phytohabitans kaempferiae TaxID=1620943 RepID=A0ABV6MD81_9ACTN
MPIPGHAASALDWLLFEQAGVVTAAHAAALLGRARVRGLLASGRWRRVCRGVLVSHNGPLTAGQALWVAVLATHPSGAPGHGALLAGLTAACEGGLRWSRPGPLYVLVPAGHPYPDLRRRLPLDMPAVVVHRTSVLPGDHVRAGRPPRTAMPRSIVDAAQWARTDDAARTVVAAACQQRRVAPEELRAVLSVMPRARRRALVLETADLAAGGATALSEIDFLRLCRRHRLPAPDLQERRLDGDGRSRYLDAYWREQRVHVEVDGAHHMDAGQWEADMRRQNEIWIRGDRVLRYSAWQVRHQPDYVVAQLRAALGLRI